VSIALLLLFLGLSALGVPLAVALGLASVAAIMMFTSTPIDLLSQSMFSAMNSFLLVAVPLFILVGHFMERGRVAERIFDFAEAMVGWIPR
jgi:TRAP-type mannitol/chloroaromatic compound transport system permease large subunit